MRRADILSGYAFRSALLAVAIMAVAFTAAGALAYHTVRRAMQSELERELVAELLLLDEVYQTGGETALIQAVHKLERPELRGNRYIALIDAHGVRLAGNLDVAPDLLDFTRRVQILPMADGTTIAASARRYETVRLVVGRDTTLIDVTLRTLLYALLAAFLLIFVAAVMTGWVLSKQSLQKLMHIADVLERVGRGDSAARIGPMRGDGQIGRIAGLIDLSLGRLSALTENSQNTIRAIAHDLRTPLNRTVIRLDEAAAAESDQGALIAAAQEELQRLGDTFDTVLRISTLTTSFDRSNFRSVDLASIVAETVPLFDADFADRSQPVEVAADTPVYARGDEQALRQLLVNLLANANRHTGPGTSIRVGARYDQGSAVLEVCDTGPGIPADQRAAVLQPFTRLDSSRSVAGTGLGLALVHAIAIRHGAAIEMDDNAPGLCVRIRFPG
ncbi:HAMP domain-containing sensor histidine kinase [Tropicimonas sp. IMCC34043]|uniref:HAMP domain-containing sensor histidine kinase n=1 Tax=Tropicimonas sp. IMCC34043 TaxID=2248760 RepID=UPI000E27C039|nr:HAMP domain-containing sensor histidine kinase [Tropicimonas sp. IMCC34043]